MVDAYFKKFYETFSPPSRVRQRLWSYIASLIDDNSKVIEIGCGPGWVINLIKDKIKSYVGYDLITEQVDFANKLLGNKKIKFINENALNNKSLKTINYNTALFIEVLEHVRNDKAVLKQIKSGTKLIISVPFEEEFIDGKSTKCAAHLRPYTIDSFKERYSELIDIENIEQYYCWIICKATKK